MIEIYNPPIRLQYIRFILYECPCAKDNKIIAKIRPHFDLEEMHAPIYSTREEERDTKWEKVREDEALDQALEWQRSSIIRLSLEIHILSLSLTCNVSTRAFHAFHFQRPILRKHLRDHLCYYPVVFCLLHGDTCYTRIECIGAYRYVFYHFNHANQETR